MATEKTDSAETEELEKDATEEEDDSKGQDETSEEETTDTDDAANEETDEEESDGDDESSDDEEPFDKRFTQFKGETLPDYAKNLEEGYAQTSKEGVKLARENKALKESIERVNQLVATNPELAKALQPGEATTDTDTVTSTQPVAPEVAWAKSEMERVWKQEYTEFAQGHPEVETDPALAEELDNALKIVRDVVWNKDKRQVGMGEGLNMAWKLLDKDNTDNQEKISMAAKNSAGQGKTASTKKADAKPKFSEAQIKYGMEAGIGTTRQEVIEKLSAYAK